MEQKEENIDVIDQREYMPVTQIYNKNQYIVGYISVKEDKEIKEEINHQFYNPVHIHPPQIYFMSFPEPYKEQEQKRKELEDDDNNYISSQSEESEEEYFNTRQFQDFEKMHFKKENINYQNAARCYFERINFQVITPRECFNSLHQWMRQYFDWARRFPPCCQRLKLFWDWVFLLNPDSGFQWRFRYMSLTWLQYMMFHVQFRESFSQWMESFGEVILFQSEDQEKQWEIFDFLTKLIYMKSYMLSCFNAQKLNTESRELEDEVSQCLQSKGILTKPEQYFEKIQCHRDITRTKINHPMFLPKLKLKKMNKECIRIDKIEKLFTFTVDEQPPLLQTE